MTWKREPPRMNRLLRIKELINQLAALELKRTQETLERMQRTVAMTQKGN